MSKMEDKPVLLSKCESPLRWPILVLACLMLLGSYYCYDIPAAIKTQIDDYMGNPSDYEMQFGLLYTLYAAPNVILPFFGGYLVDKYGVRVCLLLFASVITIGQIIVAFGISIKSWPIILLGRLVFGFGGESFTVANSAFLADWFKGRELAFAFGINLAVAKLGSVVNNIISPAMAESAGITFTFWFGSILCGVSVVCVLLAIPMDRGLEQRIALQQRYGLVSNMEVPVPDSAEGNDVTVIKFNGDDDNNSSAVEKGDGGANRDTQQEPAAPVNTTSFRDIFTLSHIFWVLVVSCVVVYGCVLPFNNISSSLLLERDYFKEDRSSCALTLGGQCQSATNPPNGNCHTSTWYQPPLPYDITIDGTYYEQVTYNDVDCQSSVWKGSSGCTQEFCTRLVDAESRASVIMSIPYIISAVLSPPLGFVIDRIGQRATIATLAPLMLIIVHSLLGYTTVTAVGPLVGQGLAYTGFVSVLWPSVPLVVEDCKTGLGFGIVTSMQNLGTAIIPLIVAVIHKDSGDKYIPNVELMFVFLGVLGVLVGFYMNYYDYKHNSVLNRGYAAAQAALEEERSMLNRFSEPLINPVGIHGGALGALGGADDDEDGDVVGELRNRSREMSHEGGRLSSTDKTKGPRGSSFTAYEEVLVRGDAKFN